MIDGLCDTFAMLKALLSRRTFGAGLAATGLILPFAPARAETVKSGSELKVIELFTSEGCWSCPPAEAKLREVADDPDILALAYHVDYWDYIGWKDPYADPAFTQRQRTYALHLRSRTVYTPQMVFQGAFHAPGSRPGEMRRELGRVDQMERITVGLERPRRHELVVSLPAHENAPTSTVLLVTYDRERTTDVLRGENAGKRLTHRNVVTSLSEIGTWRGQAADLNVTIAEERALPDTGCAILVQSDSGRIIGAAAIDMRS
ncbi:MAG: DUF1223 domain-containing protein [Rhodospirillales bacterium]